MERTLSQEDRIRRAEEIYYKRKLASGNGVRVSSDRVNVSKNKLSLFRKMILQLAICAVIYIIFYLIKNTNYVFSDDVINKTKELLSYDINFQNVYTEFSEFIENNKENKNINININSEVVTNEVNEQENSIVNEVTNEIKKETTNEEANQIVNVLSNEIKEGKETTEKNTLGIGGADTNEIIEESSKNTNSKKTQMELDAEYIKDKYSFKIPLKGTVTSRYGKREATEIISANHQGIDIGGNTGTAIYAAMEGKVTLVSSEGDYRKTYRNNKWRCNDKICSLQQNSSKERS